VPNKGLGIIQSTFLFCIRYCLGSDIVESYIRDPGLFSDAPPSRIEPRFGDFLSVDICEYKNEVSALSGLFGTGNYSA
jgi:hypothetical protein